MSAYAHMKSPWTQEVSMEWNDKINRVNIPPGETLWVTGTAAFGPPAGEEKATNPKDAVAGSKLPLHLWPNTATVAGTLGLLDGALKYGRMNWRVSGVRATVYYDAIRRHLDAWLEGEDFASDSQVAHLGHALAGLAILVDAGAAGKVVDDRLPAGGYHRLASRATPSVARLRKLHADKDPYHYTIADTTRTGMDAQRATPQPFDSPPSNPEE